MATHKFTDRLLLTFSLGGGEDHEVEVDIKYSYIPGSPATWVKSIGTWDPPDPAEIEIYGIFLHGDGVPRGIFNALYNDDELKCVLEERALDELNRGPDE